MTAFIHIWLIIQELSFFFRIYHVSMFLDNGSGNMGHV